MNDTLSQWEKQNIKANDRSEKVLKCERQLEQTYSSLRVCCMGQHIYNNNNNNNNIHTYNITDKLSISFCNRDLSLGAQMYNVIHQLFGTQSKANFIFQFSSNVSSIHKHHNL